MPVTKAMGQSSWTASCFCLQDSLPRRKEKECLANVFACQRFKKYPTRRENIPLILIYKQQSLPSDWLRTCQLIPNQRSVQIHQKLVVKLLQTNSSPMIAWRFWTSIPTLLKSINWKRTLLVPWLSSWRNNSDMVFLFSSFFSVFKSWISSIFTWQGLCPCAILSTSSQKYRKSGVSRENCQVLNQEKHSRTAKTHC